jgi:hypothetical protein
LLSDEKPRKSAAPISGFAFDGHIW